MRKTLFAPALLLALCVGKAAAFWQYGHLFVARIAYDKLESTPQGKAALAKATSLLRVYSQSHPDMTRLEGNYPLVECATFADEIKAKGGSWQSGWHFVDTPYFDKGGDAHKYPNFHPDPNSVDKAIPDIIDWLTNTGNYKSSFVYETASQQLASLTEQEKESFLLRLLIHYIGDIHQPLHATSRVDDDYPKGDAGGNFVSLPSKGGAKNLHSVWDSVLYLYTATPNLPFNAGDWSSLGKQAEDFVDHYPESNSEWQNLNAEMWREESFQIAIAAVYPTVEPGQALSQAYLAKGQDALKKSIVLGGLRLAYVIEHIYGTAQEQQVEAKPEDAYAPESFLK